MLVVHCTLKTLKGHWEVCLSCAIYFVYKSFVVEMQHILVGRWTRQLELGMLLKLPGILRRLFGASCLLWIQCCFGFVFSLITLGCTPGVLLNQMPL